MAKFLEQEKKEQKDKKQKFWQKKKQKDTLAISDNVINASKKRQK